MKNRTCNDCGDKYDAHQWNQKRCVVCIEKSDKRYNPKRLIKVCKGCGVSFRRSSPQQYYCSQECRDANMHLIYNYGITRKDFNLMKESQNNKCYICDTEGFKINKLVKESLVVDHDHKTGEVRGLLCHNCNRGLGLFQDNTTYLSKAVEYLSERATTIPRGSTPKQVEAHSKGKKKLKPFDDIV